MLGLSAYYQSPESLIGTKLRMIKATLSLERSFKDRADIKAILNNTVVKKSEIVRAAKKKGTLEIFNMITRTMFGVEKKRKVRLKMRER